MGFFKRDHPRISKGTSGDGKGPVPAPRKEHIANREQIVYIAISSSLGRQGVALSASRIPVIRSASNGRLPLCVSSKVPPWTSRRRSMPRSPRSSALSARARSCGSARTTSRWTSRRSPPARSASTSRSASAACRAGRVVEIYGPESSGKTTLALHMHRRGAEEGRHLRLHRRRARARPDLCPQARRQCRRPPDLAARHRRAGAGDRRHAGALRRDRRAGDRFGRGAGAARRARRRDGRRAARPAGAADEPGAAQAHRLDQPLQHHGDLHQPDPHEDRRDVRLARRPPPAATR